MTGNEIRKTFLDFFKGNAHAILPSSSLVPVGDPSVLFTTAGMQQFKPYYSGEKRAPHPRVATAQKVLRTSDIESVGDASHLSMIPAEKRHDPIGLSKRVSLQYNRVALMESHDT